MRGKDGWRNDEGRREDRQDKRRRERKGREKGVRGREAMK